MTVTFRRLAPSHGTFFHPFFYPIFFLLHLNLSYTKRNVLLGPVEDIKICNITTLFLDWPNWMVINIIVINITVEGYFSYVCTCSFSWYSKSSSISSSRMTNFPKSMQSVLQSSGLNSHTSFSEKLALVKSCILGAKWFVVISFWPTKNWWTERRKDIKINIEIIAKAASHKLPGSSSLNVNFLCPVCPSLFVHHVTFYLSDMLIWYTTIDLIQGRNHFPFFIQLWKSLVL